MNRKHLRGFVARRFTQGEYLGLHLRVGLLCSLCLLVAFALVAHSVQRGQYLLPFDQSLGLRLQADRQASPAVRTVFIAITELGSARALTGLTLFVGLLLLLRGRRLITLVWLIAPLGGALLDLGLKDFFQRERPLFRDGYIDTTSKSFPSGHSMGSLIGYGLLAYILVLVLPRAWMRVVAVSGSAVLVLAIGCSRIYLGAHYFSDVLGGYTVGGVWLVFCITALETIRRRPRSFVKMTNHQAPMTKEAPLSK
jgi:membrane-associated phospholipid phosphatase